MDLLLTLDGAGTLADRLYRELASAIRDERLAVRDALPPSRELAAQLGISRSTVTLAYERLTAEGYADARVGSGTFVAPGASSVARHAQRGATAPAVTAAAPPAQTAYDFRVGVPDVTLFPLAAWRRHVGRELDTIAPLVDGHADSGGHRGLREGIAHHLGIARAVIADADGVFVTSGAQQAINLLARVLLRPGDIVAVEEPGYPPVRATLEAHGARVVSMPVDAEGADPTNLPARTRLIYVTPSHQFPTGVVMSRRRRQQLLDWAASHGALVIEDDYDSEHRFFDRPLEPLHVLDRSDDGEGVVAYVGTFSKSLLPGLRVGYLIPPRHLLGPLRDARRLLDWHGDLVTQGALSRLLASGEFAAHMRRARRVYRARHRTITETLASDFPELHVLPSSAGLHLCAEIPDAAPGTARRVRDAAATSGVAVETLDAYCTDVPREGLVLGFGAIATADIPDGLRVLRSTLRRVA
ncbi:MAG: PLP-dependent aminotransferase family protein [Pseudolysinimonas sp.]